MPKPVRRKKTEAKGRVRRVIKTFSILDAYKKAYEVFKKNQKPFLKLGGIYFLCTLFYLGLRVGFKSVVHVHNELLEIVLFTGVVLLWFVRLYFEVALIRLALKLVKGKRTAQKKVFGSWQGFGRYFRAAVMVGLLILGGMFLLIVPGLIAVAAFGLASIIALEYRTETWRSLEISWEMTRDVRLMIWGMMLFSFLVEGVGVLCFGIGYVVAKPLTILAWVVAYRELERQTKLPKLELLKAKV